MRARRCAVAVVALGGRGAFDGQWLGEGMGGGAANAQRRQHLRHSPAPPPLTPALVPEINDAQRHCHTMPAHRHHNKALFERQPTATRPFAAIPTASTLQCSPPGNDQPPCAAARPS
eukprot:5339-Chlamydomonas_euryale.AAC.3